MYCFILTIHNSIHFGFAYLMSICLFAIKYVNKINEHYWYTSTNHKLGGLRLDIAIGKREHDGAVGVGDLGRHLSLLVHIPGRAHTCRADTGGQAAASHLNID